MEASANVSNESVGVEENTVKCEEEEDSEEQKDDVATDKLREVQTSQSMAQQTRRNIDVAPMTATWTVMEGTYDNDEVSKEDLAEELTATSADNVTQEEEVEELITTSPDTVPKEEEEEEEEEEEQQQQQRQLMTTSVEDVTKEEEDKIDIKCSIGPGSETLMAVKEDIEEPNEGHSGSQPGVGKGENLDELMDMGTVDQEEQEAQMKDEEENTSDSENDSATMRMCSALEKEDALSLMGNNIKVVKVAMEEADDVCSLTQPQSPIRLCQHRLQALTQPPRLSPNGGPPSPSQVTVKDEPIDEEYNQALFSSSAPTDDIKDEPEPEKKELMISSVFSVEGKSSSARLMTRPAPSVAKPSPPPAPAPVRCPSTLYVVCSHCKTFMIKGQTAYQKKGSPELYCSPACLSAKPQEPVAKICHHCSKPVSRPADLIRAPVDGASVRDFCSPACLTAFSAMQAASLKTNAPAPVMNTCSVCKKPIANSKHEVALQGVTHRICNNVCFSRFRAAHKLNVSTCAICCEYFASKILVLRTATGIKNLCSDACLAKYKEQSTTPHPCSMCATMTPLSKMVDEKNSQGVVETFCTTGCLLAHKIQSISSSGTTLPCNNCERYKVPAYHLAMSDSSIRNFCSLPCVLGFQEKHHHKTPKGGPLASRTPILSNQDNTTAFPAAAIAAVANPSITLQRQANTTSTTTTTSTSSLTEATSKSGVPKLHCPICERAITSYPEVVQEKDKIMFLCGVDCAEEFKTLHCSQSRCEYCKLLKVPADVKRIGSKNCSFCSEGCKLLYKHELSKQWGSHCRCCAYCFSISRSLVSTRYAGKIEEFCSEHCRNKYTLLIQQLAMCETCGARGKLTMTMPLLGSPKRFCRLQCMLKFCCAQTPDSKPTKKSESPVTSELVSTPVIANVVSLASRPSTKPNAAPNVARQGTVPSLQLKSLGNAGTQTDTVRVPPPTVKILKNKALLCRPMVQHQETTCKPDMVDTEVQTDEPIRVIVVPVPVPVYIPVPMAMYSQYCPAPMSMPLPLPVPMMLPVTLDSAESVVETIRQIKDKIPSDPLEADLILMAEIVAEQEEREVNEQREGRERAKVEREGKGRGRGPEEREKGKKKKAEKRTRAVEQEKDGLDLLNEYINNYSSDLDPEIPESLLGSWEDSPSSVGLLSDNQPLSKEKLQPITDIPVGGSFEPPVEIQPPEPLPMDIETDITVDTLEQLAAARLRETKLPETKRRAAPTRRQRKAREKKKGRQTAEVPETSRAPRLESKYGIDAWERWVRWRKTQPDLQTPRIHSRPLELKEDVLRCTTTELSYGLCRFALEVKRPNGEPYLPDSLFYLCLGIQQHLFENSRVENIFTDVFYSKFSTEITKLLKDFKPTIASSGYIHSRVEEEYLWDCKQLGAYSPIVLLNTLLFFCSKFLGFTTVRQHHRLSFAHFMRCSRNNPDNTKTIFLRFYPPADISSTIKYPPADTDATAAKRSRQDEDQMLDMVENQENPLRCPVRLYEFYLSKCSETVKQRSNVFYLRPERSCVPNSPLWFSGTPLDDATLGGMLTRILSVREMHLRAPPVAATAAATPRRQREGPAVHPRRRPGLRRKTEEEEEKD